jgi:hypothetical protein
VFENASMELVVPLDVDIRHDRRYVHSRFTGPELLKCDADVIDRCLADVGDVHCYEPSCCA